MVDEVLKETPEQKEQVATSPDFSAEQKDLTDLQTKVTTENLKKELVDTQEIDSDWSYEIIKGSKMYDKLLTLLGSETKVEIFALEIDKVVRKYLDQELEGFPNSIKNSMSVGIQFTMMETLVKQGAQGSAQFFDAFAGVKSKSTTKAFEGLYKAFGSLGSVNEFYILANKVQNLTWFISNKKNSIDLSKNIPELMNPNQFRILLNKPIWSNQKQIDVLDINKILTLDSSTALDIHAGEDELKNIINNDALSGVITEKTISAIQKSLQTADKLLENRGKFKNKSSDLIDKIAGFLDINIPFLGNFGEMVGMEFPTDILGEKKDGGILNFVLGVLGFQNGIAGLHKTYIKEKLDILDIDNDFIRAVYTNYQKNITSSLTHDSPESIWKICALTAPDTTIETAMKSKIPTDYLGLKKSLIDNLSTDKLQPLMVAKFAPEMIITGSDGPIIDITKISANPDIFIDTYLKYIIPLLADPSDDFITSKNIDTNAFTLAVIGGLTGDKYFIEGVNIGLLSSLDFASPLDVPPTSDAVPNQTKLDVINGKIDFSTGKFTPEQITNINFIIDEMNKNGVNNPNTQIGILSVIGKESGFIPKNELSYADTSNKDIRTLFGNRLPASESELTALKKDPAKFFDAVYGKQATAKLGWDTGNIQPGDGYTYRGRGFNQLTFKNNYKKYAEITGTDILNNPDSLNDPIVASKVALAFFTQGKEYSSLPQFTDKNTAATYFADINAGGDAGKNREHALQTAEKFDVQPTIA